MFLFSQLLTQEEFERLALLREREAEKPTRKRKREDRSSLLRDVADTVDVEDIEGYVFSPPGAYILWTKFSGIFCL